MNIIEAAKAGKRIRRKSWTEVTAWFRASGITYGIVDVLADDWEVEETPITLTRTKFEAACEKAKAGDTWGSANQLFRNLAKELGFGEGEE